MSGIRQVGVEFVSRGKEEVTRDVKSLGNEMNNLGDKVLRGTAYAQRLEKQYGRLDRALNTGKISLYNYGQAIQALDARIEAAYQGNLDFARSATVVAGAMNRQTAANQFASRSMNGTGMAMQQVGYQVGDFLVQVQSGTNAFVAFGQQATQLVGILPLMGAGFLGLSTGGLIALASGLGIAIPLVTALGAAFVRTRQNAQDAAEETFNFVAALRELEDISNRTNLFSGIGDSVTEEFEPLRQFLESGMLDEIRRQFGDARSQITEGITESIIEMERQIENAEIRAAGLAFQLEVSGDTVPGLNEQLQQTLQFISDTEQAVREQSNAFTIIQGIAGETRQEFAESFALAVRRLQTEELMTDEIRQSLFAFAEANGLASELARILGVAANEAGNVGRSLLAALNLSSAVTSRMTERGVASGAIPPQALQDLPPGGAEQEFLEAQREAFRQSRLPQSSGGGGGGASAFQSQIEGIRALQEAIAAAEEQAALFGQEVDLLDSALQHGLITQQEYNTLLTQAQEAYGQTESAAYDYQSAIEQIAETSRSAMSDAFMSIVDGSATAADAFKNMAREILAQAFELLVVQPIMDSIFGGGGGGFLGGLFGGVSKNEYGNAFYGGRVIPFANGGVVSSPTMFPMRGNQTGLMGEAGPEAIMPLKRGRDGKLGVQAESGGGNVVVNNHFHFQANGDESVKRIIAQEAPKIANLTQQQIIDQRKRGGVMKATF